MGFQTYTHHSDKPVVILKLLLYHYVTGHLWDSKRKTNYPKKYFIVYNVHPHFLWKV